MMVLSEMFFCYSTAIPHLSFLLSLLPTNSKSHFYRCVILLSFSLTVSLLLVNALVHLSQCPLDLSLLTAFKIWLAALQKFGEGFPKQEVKRSVGVYTSVLHKLVEEHCSVLLCGNSLTWKEWELSTRHCWSLWAPYPVSRPTWTDPCNCSKLPSDKSLYPCGFSCSIKALDRKWWCFRYLSCGCVYLI